MAHDFTEWLYCEDFHSFKFTRSCMTCGEIQFSDNPCEENDE